MSSLEPQSKQTFQDICKQAWYSILNAKCPFGVNCTLLHNCMVYPLLPYYVSLLLFIPNPSSTCFQVFAPNTQPWLYIPILFTLFLRPRQFSIQVTPTPPPPKKNLCIPLMSQTQEQFLLNIAHHLDSTSSQLSRSNVLLLQCF